ncbi:MAG: Pycsar system effector family protein [Bacteroidota bacterium]
MDEKTDFLLQIEDYVKDSLQKELPKEVVYHNLDHTIMVVNAAKEIGQNSGLTEEDLEIVTIAAWFHDLGYKESGQNHEEISAKLATEFLSEHAYEANKINKVNGCILATKMPQSPKNLLEEVVCDADLHHLGTEDYFQMARRLKDEINNNNTDELLTDAKWMQMNIDFIKEHSYFTDYAENKFGVEKLKNRKKVKKKLKKKVTPEIDQYLTQINKLETKLEKIKTTKPDRGIETMFRLTSKNHLDLSSMADNKANIMISVNSIILSIVLTVLFRKLDEYPHFLIPTVILTVVCLATIVFSILATLPNVSKGKFTRDNIINKETNLLFFGNFHGMKLPDYEWGMKQMMKDGDYLYTSLIRDIYFLGVVLGKKYKMLRTSYTIFMFGFVLAVLSFIIAESLFKPEIPF